MNVKNTPSRTEDFHTGASTIHMMVATAAASISSTTQAMNIFIPAERVTFLSIITLIFYARGEYPQSGEARGSGIVLYHPLVNTKKNKKNLKKIKKINVGNFAKISYFFKTKVLKYLHISYFILTFASIN